MEIRYLIDTDWVINCLHGVERVLTQLEPLRPQGIGISIISLAELYDGIMGDADPERSARALHTFLSDDMPTVSIDLETCRRFARERRRLRAAGNLIPDFDLMIAATALRYDLTLLTNNRRHFHRFADLTILSA